MTDELVFRTPKMALVAFLRYRDISYDRMELKREQVTWVFLRDTVLDREVDVFRRGEAAVEPVAYTQTTARVREEMFKFKEEQQGAAAA